MSDTWKKIKLSGHFKRKIRINYQKIVNTPPIEVLEADENNSPSFQHVPETVPSSVSSLPETYTSGIVAVDKLSKKDQTEIPSAPIPPNDGLQNEILYAELQQWAVSFNIKQNALKELFNIFDKRLPNVFPKDPRTFLKNDRVVQIRTMGDGQYWHNSFRECLEQAYPAIHHLHAISIKINIDGLPVYKSSKDEFWPVLFNIEEALELQPMILEDLFWQKQAL
ncbi:AAEL011785-PA [Aedes aegypti]|uniref:AAEL011785-PA n=1 Tax=Aedes aegypti TaxID=7159 RepID=Q16P25_AEDAE|nr:AAEL011785-PA [Aedes aegypti]